jgi:hypothetical protein
MTTDVTYHITEEADVLFMAAKKPSKNKWNNNKEEYVVKLKFLDGSKTIEHLSKIAESKVDTKTNRKLTGEKHISFKSNYQPVVLDADGNKLTVDGIPYFRSNKDKGRALVVYTVKQYEDSNQVYLHGVKIMSLDLAPKEEFKPVGTIIDEIKQFLN